MAIAVDASTPATPTTKVNLGNSINSNSFSPPASSYIVALVGGTNTSTATITGTVSWNSGGNGTWTLAGRKNGGGTGSFSTAEVWYCQITGSAPGASVVNFAHTGAVGNSIGILTIQVLTGVLSGAASVGATAGQSSNASTAINESITPQASGSLIVTSCALANVAVFTNESGCTTFANDAHTTPNLSDATGKLSALTSNTNPVTVGWTPSQTFSASIAQEILAVASAPATTTTSHLLASMGVGQ